ncbi:MAG: 1-deoxy-D-xylulose-5-phosphate reductoisomerase, partial [Clostridia bacterium]|nr:1-deoxy-D-xylulose-5-phosphate reductoisomerase [Clostridia bacterium]
MEFIHNITLLGSTGSIGTQTLEIARRHKGINVLGLSAQSNIALLEEQIRFFKPKIACVADCEKAKELKIKISDTNTKLVSGNEGLEEVASVEGAQTAVVAVVGISGLLPTIAAIKAGKNIALANKETLVAGGHLVTKLAKDHNIAILPVDSEHSAIFQALEASSDKREIKKIILTASGGPFFGKSRKELESVAPEAALCHPNWNMGAKVTVDSATLANKGLEVIEAKWLFDVDIEKIQVLVHRQSVVHSMVEYIDNSIIAQMGAPDMRTPIQLSL